MKKIFIGSDHTGTKMVEELIQYIKSKNIEVEKSKLENNPLDDYPDFAFEIGEKVVEFGAQGILICGNGIGISIAANKVNGVRCARVLTEDDAFKCKNHNGANIIALSAGTDIELTKKIVDTFLNTERPKEERHINRVNKIFSYEQEVETE